MILEAGEGSQVLAVVGDEELDQEHEDDLDDDDDAENIQVLEQEEEAVEEEWSMVRG